MSSVPGKKWLKVRIIFFRDSRHQNCAKRDFFLAASAAKFCNRDEILQLWPMMLLVLMAKKFVGTIIGTRLLSSTPTGGGGGDGCGVYITSCSLHI